MFLLSGYTSILYFAVLGIMLIIMAIRSKRYDVILFLIFVALFSFVFTICLYPHYFNGFFVGRGAQSIQKLHSATFRSFVITPLYFILSQCQSHVFYIPTVILSLAMLIVCRTKDHCRYAISERSFALAFVNIATAFWMLLIAVFMPYHDLCHLQALFPLCCLVFPIIAKLCGKKGHTYLAVLLSLYVIALPLQFVLRTKPLGPRVEYLYPEDPKKYYCLQDESIPIVMVMSPQFGSNKYSFIAPLFNDNQTIYFTFAPSKFDDTNTYEDFISGVPFDDFYLVTFWVDSPYNDSPFDVSTFHGAVFDDVVFGDNGIRNIAWYYEKRITKK